VLLQIMDHGKLTDHNGKAVNFRNVILIMTTNAGAADMAKSAFGFKRSKREGDDHEAINRQFAPEFRNRLDAIVSFAHLNHDVIGMVVEKFVLQLEAQLADRDVTIELSDPAKAWLIEHGYDEQMGARPMARIIQEHVKKPLADEVLFGKLKGGGHVRVVLVKDEETAKDKIGFEYVEGPVTPKPEKLPGSRKRKPKGSDGPSGPAKGPLLKVCAANHYGQQSRAVIRSAGFSLSVWISVTLHRSQHSIKFCGDMCRAMSNGGDRADGADHNEKIL